MDRRVFSESIVGNPMRGNAILFMITLLLTPNRRNSFGLANDIVCGYSTDTYKPILFDYAKGTEELHPMGSDIRDQPMSLWNFAFGTSCRKMLFIIPWPDIKSVRLSVWLDNIVGSGIRLYHKS